MSSRDGEAEPIGRQDIDMEFPVDLIIGELFFLFERLQIFFGHLIRQGNCAEAVLAEDHTFGVSVSRQRAVFRSFV